MAKPPHSHLVNYVHKERTQAGHSTYEVIYWGLSYTAYTPVSNWKLFYNSNRIQGHHMTFDNVGRLRETCMLTYSNILI